MAVLGLSTVPRSSDAESLLVGYCQTGDVEAFAELVARYRDGVYSFARHLVGDETEAQDLAQEAFVRAYAALPRFRPGAPFEPWLYTIAANLCRSHLRKRGRKPLSLDADASGDRLPAPDADPAALAERREERRRLLAAIRSLPTEQRFVVVLRHLQERSYREIAALLQLPVSTVEHRLRAARKALRVALTEADPGR